MSVKDAMKAWKNAPGVTVIDLDSDLGFVTPAEIAGEDDVFVSRVRQDETVPNGLNFWCVSDNLRKGAALNAVQIAEVLIQNYKKAPQELKDCVKDLDEHTKDAQQAADMTELEQCIMDMEATSDRARDAVERSGDVDSEAKQAVLETHQKLSKLKHQLH